MGYDYVTVRGGVDFPTQKTTAEDTAVLTKGLRAWTNSVGPINSMEDVESYPWPHIKDEKFWQYEFVARNLPAGMGILACPASGPFEIACTRIGYQSLCYLIHDHPEVVHTFIHRVGQAALEAYRRVCEIPEVVGFFQGDDMGYKSATMVGPDFLNSHVLPWHKRVAQLAHSRGKVFFLHSCGNLEAIMPELIDEVKIDAKHSFEDEIVPVEAFATRYGLRIGILGGVPVDLLARSTPEAVRRRTRQILNTCMPLGRYALGSGNSVNNYVKPENFLAMLDESLAWFQS